MLQLRPLVISLSLIFSLSCWISSCQISISAPLGIKDSLLEDNFLPVTNKLGTSVFSPKSSPVVPVSNKAPTAPVAISSSGLGSDGSDLLVANKFQRRSALLSWLLVSNFPYKGRPVAGISGSYVLSDLYGNPNIPDHYYPVIRRAGHQFGVEGWYKIVDIQWFSFGLIGGSTIHIYGVNNTTSSMVQGEYLSQVLYAKIFFGVNLSPSWFVYGMVGVSGVYSMPPDSFDDNWIFGAGLEYRLSGRLGFKFEYNFVYNKRDDILMAIPGIQLFSLGVNLYLI